MRTIDVNELKDMMDDQNPPVINVLSREDFAKGHIPGSHNIPHDDPDFVSKVEQLAGSKYNPVVVYCANTSCDASPNAAKKLEEEGFAEVYDFEGGVQDWKDAGERIESGQPARA